MIDCRTYCTSGLFGLGIDIDTFKVKRRGEVGSYHCLYDTERYDNPYHRVCNFAFKELDPSNPYRKSNNLYLSVF